MPLIAMTKAMCNVVCACGKGPGATICQNKLPVDVIVRVSLAVSRVRVKDGTY